MDTRTFDAIARSLSTTISRRRTAQSLLGTLLTGGTLGALVARLGSSEDTAAKAKKERHKRGEQPQPARGLQTEGKRNKRRNGKPKGKKRCDPLTVPLCTNCSEPRCNTSTGKWSCRGACPAEEDCCGGTCHTPCFNGCEMDPGQECICQTPPTGEDVYCALEHVCGPNPCPPGKEYGSSTCTCRSLCPEGCPEGMEQDPSSCECRCSNGNPMCGGACCPADTVTCWWVPHLPQRYCQLADGRWVCPIGWTGSRETGCFPPSTPETFDFGGNASTRHRHAKGSPPEDGPVGAKAFGGEGSGRGRAEATRRAKGG